MKKIIFSILLAVVMLLGMIPFSALTTFAAEEELPTPTVTVDEDGVATWNEIPGANEYRIYVYLEGNYALPLASTDRSEPKYSMFSFLLNSGYDSGNYVIQVAALDEESNYISRYGEASYVFNLGHDHSWITEWWSGNDTYHWHECSNFGECYLKHTLKDGYAEHEYVDGVCVCGKVQGEHMHNYHYVSESFAYHTTVDEYDNGYYPYFRCTQCAKIFTLDRVESTREAFRKDEAHGDANSDGKCDLCGFFLTEIEAMNIKGIPAPQYGNTVEDYYNILESKLYDGTFTVNDVVYDTDTWNFGNIWLDDWVLCDSTKAYMGTTDVIGEGTYYLCTWLGAEEGFTVTEDLVITVEGINSADITYELFDVNENEGYAEIYIKFEVTAPTITITGITAPQAGQSVEEWYAWFDDNDPVFSPNYDWGGGRWYEGAFDKFEDLIPHFEGDPFMGNFESGQSYTLYLWLESETPTLPLSATLNVPGATSAVYDYFGEEDGWYYADIMIVYTVGDITVNGFPAPQAGQSVEGWWNSIPAPVTLSGGVTWMGEENMFWLEGEYDNVEDAAAVINGNGPFGGTFEDGKKYTFIATVVPDGGELPAAATVVASGASNTAYEKFEEGVAILFLTYTVGGDADIVIENLPLPEAGQTIAEYDTVFGEMVLDGSFTVNGGVYDEESYTFGDVIFDVVEFLDGSMNYIDYKDYETLEFAPGTYYMEFIFGEEFDENSIATVDGVRCKVHREATWPAGWVAVLIEFNVTEEGTTIVPYETDTITVGGITAPQAGQSVEEWAKDISPVFSPAYDLDVGAWVEGEYVNWEEAVEVLDNVGPFEGTFEDGKKYTLVAIVIPDDGETPAEATVVASGASNTAYEKLEERVAALFLTYTVGASGPTLTVSGIPIPDDGQTVEQWNNSGEMTITGADIRPLYFFVLEGRYTNTTEVIAYVTGGGRPMTDADIFEAGKQYTLYFGVVPTDETPLPASATVTAAGTNSATYELWTDPESGDPNGIFFLTYTAGAEPITITGLPVPQVGQTAEQWGASITTPPTISPALDWEPIAFVEAKINTYEELMAFLEGGGQPYTAPFTNKQYTLILGAKANAEVALPRYGAVSAAGTSSTGYDYIEDPAGNYAFIFLTYTLGESDATDTLAGVPVPLAGESAENYIDGVMGYLTEFTGYFYADAILDGENEFTGTFVAGKQYTIVGYLRFDYGFGAPASLNVTVDGADSVQYQRLGDEIGMLRITFTAKEKSGTVISSVNVTSPAIGEVLGFGNPCVTDNANVMATLYFTDSDFNFVYTLENDSVYMLFIQLVAKNGATLSPELTVTLNGKAINLSTELGTENSRFMMGMYFVGDPALLTVGNVPMKNGDYLANGANATTKEKPASGGYAYYNDGVLTLHDFRFEKTLNQYDYVIECLADLRIVLEGDNYLTAGTALEAGTITAVGTVEIGGSGSLYLISNDYGIFSDTGVIITGGNIEIENCFYTINTYGQLKITGGNVVVHGRVSAQTGNSKIGLLMTGGTLTINYELDDSALLVSGLSITNATLNVNNDENIAIHSYNHGFEINAGAVVNVNAPKAGYVVGGGFYYLTVNGGTLNVNAPKAVLEVAGDITFNGNVDLTIKGPITATNGGSFKINGGNVTVKAEVRAFGTAPTISGDLYAQAATTVDGTMNPYVAANNNTYKHVVIAAEATAEPEIYVGGVGLVSGEYLANGSDTPVKDKPASGGYAYYKDGVLTLNNYVYEGTGYETGSGVYAIIYSRKAFELVLEGESTLTQSDEDSRGIFANNKTVTVSGDGSLNLAGGFYAFDASVVVNSGTIACAATSLFSLYGGNHVINGGTLDLHAPIFGYDFTLNDGDVMVKVPAAAGSGYGAYLKGNVVINDGSFTVANGAYIGNMWGLRSDKAIVVNGGTVNISSNKQALEYAPTVGAGMAATASTTVDGTMNPYVAGDNKTYKHVVIAAEAPVYSLSAGDVDFGTKIVGYDSIADYPVITNTGDQILMFGSAYMKAELTGSGASAFTFGWNSYSGAISVGNSSSGNLWVRLKDGLTVGTYTATMTLYYDRDGEGTAYGWEVLDTATITAKVDPKPVYTITVINGTASPSTATAGTQINLTANAAPEGMEFDRWVITSGTGFIGDAVVS